MRDERRRDPEERGTEQVPEDPTVEADDAAPTEPGPGDSEGARPEPEDEPA